MKKLIFSLILGIALIAAPAAYADVATFDDNYLAPETNWGGAGSGETGFNSGDAYFNHNDGTYSWDGFVYSNRTDTTTAGVSNQFSAITGGGVNGSANYCISYQMADWAGGTYDPIPNTSYFGFDTGNDYNTTISGAYFTNTTYAYLSMQDGDSFAKKFGGVSGTDEDWFLLSIKGVDENLAYTGTVAFYLADYRFADSADDYMIDDWTWVDLPGLGDVIGLEYTLTSSDAGPYGINTPTYFAVDNLNAVPVPAAVWLLGSAFLCILGIRRKN